MTPLNISIIVVLTLVACAILGTLLYFVVRPVQELIQKSRAQSHLVKKMKTLQEIDLLMEDGNTEAALELLAELPMLTTPNSLDFLTATRDHNQVFLARCLALSDTLGVGIANIELIEHRINEHAELSTLLFKVQLSFDTLLGKRENLGKDIPKWTRDEFEKKQSEIKQTLHENRQILEKEIARMVSALRTRSATDHMIH